MAALAAGAPGAIPTVQNTVRFYELLLARGYPDEALRRARAASAVARALFSGRMHPSGKPYLAHCIGTAGTLAALALPVDLIVAGLVHDAYGCGDFGPWRPFAPLQRAYLRRRLGAPAESHVYRHRTLAREPGAGDASPLPADPVDRGVLLIRLACQLDALRDRGVLYAADAEAGRERVRRTGPRLVAAAAALDRPDLGAALAAAIEETLEGEVPAVLRSRLGAPPVLAPQGATARLEARVVGALTRTGRAGDRRAS